MNDDNPIKKRKGFARDMARKTLDEYFLRNPPIRIPIPIDKVAEFYGFEIFELNDLNEHQRAIKKEIKSENRKLIGLNASYPFVNKRFSIGHELGHHFLGHEEEDDCHNEENIVNNREADEFSAELLIPLSILKKLLKEKNSPAEIARLLIVSEQALWLKIINQNLSHLITP